MQGGCRILLTKILFTSLEITLAEDDELVGERRVAKVTIVDHGSSSGGGTDMDLTAPPSFCARSSVPGTWV